MQLSPRRASLGGGGRVQRRVGLGPEMALSMATFQGHHEAIFVKAGG